MLYEKIKKTAPRKRLILYKDTDIREQFGNTVYYDGELTKTFYCLPVLNADIRNTAPKANKNIILIVRKEFNGGDNKPPIIYRINVGAHRIFMRIAGADADIVCHRLTWLKISNIILVDISELS